MPVSEVDKMLSHGEVMEGLRTWGEFETGLRDRKLDALLPGGENAGEPAVANGL